jgi:hypothetical protein
MKTDKQKIRMYEDLLHKIQLCAEVAMDGEKTKKLISNICRWSYAHRCGNGELSDEQQTKLIDNAFNRLLET